MKALITYFSQSGNTEKIALAMQAEFKEGNVENTLKKVSEVSDEDLKGADLILLGSPLHSGALAAPVTALLGRLAARPGQKLAAFITHFAPAYPEQDMTKFVNPIVDACKENEIEYKGSFDCQGFLSEALHEQVKEGHKFSDEQWAEMVKQMTGHPNEEDEAKARTFAKTLIN